MLPFLLLGDKHQCGWLVSPPRDHTHFLRKALLAPSTWKKGGALTESTVGGQNQRVPLETIPGLGIFSSVTECHFIPRP